MKYLILLLLPFIISGCSFFDDPDAPNLDSIGMTGSTVTGTFSCP